MGRYNYLKAMVADIKGYIRDRESLKQREDETTNEYYGRLYYALIEVDAITGGTSGAYACKMYAEEYLCHNWDLLNEALAEVSYDEMGKLLEMGAQACDVKIREYLLPKAIDKAIHELVVEELRESFDSRRRRHNYDARTNQEVQRTRNEAYSNSGE